MMQMRKKDKEITDRQEIEKILQTARVCRIAMVDGNLPYVVPLNFGYADGVVYFHCAREGRKVDVIKKNPNVCFETDEMIRLEKAGNACDWGAQYRSVIAAGTARFLETREEKIKGLDVIMHQYSNRNFTYADDMLEKTAVCEVRLTHISAKQS